MIPFDAIQARNFPLGYMRIRHWILKKVMLRSIKDADLVIFISNYAREVIEREIDGALKKTAIIPHGVSPEFRTTANGNGFRPAWLPTDKYLLYVSNLDFYKSQIEVVQAYALLKKLRHSREKLVFVGTESPEYGRKVRKEIRRLGLQNDVLIRGPVPYIEMPALYKHALLNIFASKCENCPNILLEAMASGRPVIVSNYPPMPEFAGDAALYFDPTIPEDLANKLASVLSDPGRLRELGVRAGEQSRLFDWRRTARDTWDALESLA
jgi:glycosyltransferase involved in cell wall biosynthesis